MIKNTVVSMQKHKKTWQSIAYLHVCPNTTVIKTKKQCWLVAFVLTREIKAF